MSDKALSELEWKKFSKGRDFKDSAFTKALALLERAKGPDAELEALADIEKQADVLRKAGKADKTVGAYFDDVDKAIVKQRKLSEMEAKKAAAASDDEEEETPQLLTSKMVPLLRLVKKGTEMNVMLASTGKEVAVLMSRRAISPSRRKLLTEYLDGGTPKFYPGHCIFEEKAYTFVMKTQVAGLAKKVRAALLKQVELRLKVRVRGEDPNDIDDDGEPADDNDIPEDGPATPTAASAPAAAAKPEPAAEDPLKAVFETRMAALQPLVLQVLKDQKGDVSKIRAVAEFVREKGDTGQYKAAVAGLESLVKLVDAARGVPDAPPLPAAGASKPAAAAPDEATLAFTARLSGLSGAIKTGLAVGGEYATDVKLKVSEAGVFARKKEFDQANRLLDELEVLLRGKSGAPAGTEPGTGATATEKTAAAGSSADQFAALRARMEADYLAATAAGADTSLAEQIANVRRAWDMADESQESGNIDRALTILKRLAEGGALDKLVAARKASDAAPGAAAKKTGPSLVKQRQFMLTRWARIPKELKAELQGLRQIIVDEDIDEDPDELVDGIDAHLEKMLGDVQTQLDKAINAGDTSVFKNLRQRLENDSVLSHLLSAPFMDGTRFKKTTLDAIDEIESALTA